MRGQVNAATFRPPRLNFAGACIWCAKRWCESPVCVAKHERSTWGVCENCEGGTLDGFGADCCLNGVVEMTPLRAQRRAREFPAPVGWSAGTGLLLGAVA